jgi:hypothetical protein
MVSGRSKWNQKYLLIFAYCTLYETKCILNHQNQTAENIKNWHLHGISQEIQILNFNTVYWNETIPLLALWKDSKNVNI